MPRRPRRLNNDINVVPYIDVMLVLLVIFMVTAPLINPGSIDLPQVSKALAQPDQPIEVDIHKDGSLSVVDRSAGPAETRLRREELVDWIRVRQAQHPDQPVVIAGDRNVKYDVVLQVMDALQQGAIRRIGLLAKPREG